MGAAATNVGVLEIYKSSLSEWKMTPFIVLSYGRTGSTYLAQSLSLHSNIRMYHELLKFPNGGSYNGCTWDGKKDSYQFIRETIFPDPRPFDTFSVGFKLFYFHATSEKVNGIWEAIQNNRIADLKVITLHAENTLRAYLSEQRARKTTLWHPKNTNQEDYYRNVRLDIDVKHLTKSLASKDRSHTIGEKIRQQYDGIAITFEDLVDDPQAALYKIARYLGGNEELRYPVFRDSAINRGSTTIVNYDEVVDALEKVQKSWMLKEFVERP